jgi:hypothetical protein
MVAVDDFELGDLFSFQNVGGSGEGVSIET